jgi:hypothetical protein
MTAKRRNLFLYLTLACFLGIIAIFIFDGYMGFYDTIYLTTGEYEQKIEPDIWMQPNPFWSASVNQGGKIYFRYEVDNRRFSEYTADVAVSVWRSQTKVSDLLSQKVSLGGFARKQLEWEVDTTGLLPGDLPQGQGYDFSVVIKMGEMERRIIVYVNPIPYPPPKLEAPRQL